MNVTTPRAVWMAREWLAEFEKKMAHGTVTASSRDTQSNYSKQLMLDAIAGECGAQLRKKLVALVQ